MSFALFPSAGFQPDPFIIAEVDGGLGGNGAPKTYPQNYNGTAFSIERASANGNIIVPNLAANPLTINPGVYLISWNYVFSPNAAGDVANFAFTITGGVGDGFLGPIGFSATINVIAASNAATYGTQTLWFKAKNAISLGSTITSPAGSSFLANTLDITRYA